VVQRALVERALKAEESAFAQTLDAGMMRLDAYRHASNNMIDGEQLFQLHDTYGCPPDLIADILREQGGELTPSAMADYEQLMDQQRNRARAAGKFGGGLTLPAELVAQLEPTGFLGYDTLEADELTVVGLLRDGRPVDSVAAGDAAVVLLDRTPFYAESGGQVGDSGRLETSGAAFAVTDTQKLAGQFHAHVGRVENGSLRVGDRLGAAVDAGRRAATIRNHSATHLLHAALRTVLGSHVAQKGSLVAPDRLRFDFSHFQPVSADEIATIERMVNAEIRANHAVETHHMDMQEALDFGAMALFGEKYGERVRVLRMGQTSTELCGGTHVARTGDIGLFKIISESGVSAGVRRIEALSGEGALEHVAQQERRLDDAAQLLGAPAVELGEKLRALLDRQKKLERELESARLKLASGATADLAAQASDIDGIRVLAARLENLDARELREAVDRLKQQLGNAVVVLAGVGQGKAALVAGVSGSATGRVKAGELLAHIAGLTGGKGGGRPDLAQGGGNDGPALVQALAGVNAWVADRLRSRS
jgi:alanyl-tRNA synthetase